MTDPDPAVVPGPALISAIAARGEALRRRITERTDRPVTIVCVTKAHPPEVAAAARLAGIPGRGGCDPNEAPDLVQRCRDLGLAVEGLMGVGPPGPPEDARAGFRLLDRLAADLGLAVRSMGMSGDLDVAVEEGATMVRIGSALVGPRERA